MLPTDHKISILHFWNSGIRSPREISRKTGISCSTVSYNIRKLKALGSLNHVGGNGRKRSITASAARTVGQLIRREKQTSAAEISVELRMRRNLAVSVSTVRRHLRRKGYKSCLPKKKPMLTDQQRHRRLQWAMAHKDDDWRRTVFSDESSIQLFRNTVRCWTKNPRIEIKRVPKNRTKIFVWGAISSKGVIGLCLFRGIMDSARYIDILKKNLLPATGRIFGNNWRFQHDNDPKHTARMTKRFLDETVPMVIDWPANSPDLNPIENIWGLLKHRVEKRRPKSIDELERFFMDEWSMLDQKMINNFLKSMKSRCEGVIRNNGNHLDF